MRGTLLYREKGDVERVHYKQNAHWRKPEVPSAVSSHWLSTEVSHWLGVLLVEEKIFLLLE